MKLLIVESPNKIKQLKALLGDGYEVAASVGHIRDLPARRLGIDRYAGYKMEYEIKSQKENVIHQLQDTVNHVGKDNVLLATDPDREGEAIAYHLCQVLGIDSRQAQRIVFQEITDKAIQDALLNIRRLDTKLIAAQEARRAIDRLVGYEISPLLYRKAGKGLSAGRVQSVALRLVVDRERSIERFTVKFNYQVSGEFRTIAGKIVKATRLEAFPDEMTARAYLGSAKAKIFTVTDIQTQQIEVTPSAPFITATLQQEGVKELKWNAVKVMDVAQRLFENGHITYLRTDSPNLSEEAVGAIRKYVENTYGSNYFQERRFKSKDTAQEAHEAIRPTCFNYNRINFENNDQLKLFKLIHSRAIASQMTPSRYQQTLITITEQDYSDIYLAKNKILKFDGFSRVSQENGEENNKQDESTTFEVSEGEQLKHEQLCVKQIYSMPPERYNEATLIEDLEHKGIGRPSTYASITSNILKREYVYITAIERKKVSATIITWRRAQGIIKLWETVMIEEDKEILVPSETGKFITNFLEKYFGTMVSYSFTADVERQLDRIVSGELNFIDVVRQFDATHAQQIALANRG